MYLFVWSVFVLFWDRVGRGGGGAGGGEKCIVESAWFPTWGQGARVKPPAHEQSWTSQLVWRALGPLAPGSMACFIVVVLFLRMRVTHYASNVRNTAGQAEATAERRVSELEVALEETSLERDRLQQEIESGSAALDDRLAALEVRQGRRRAGRGGGVGGVAREHGRGCVVFIVSRPTSLLCLESRREREA